MSQFGSEVAAVIMEPMASTFPNLGFLESVKKLTHSHGALLIFDETITGFRFSTGGAQELFGVTPDISTFGKGMANGFPISAVVGRRDVMMEMEEIFFSGTFGGELLSLAAAKHVLTRHLNENISAQIEFLGEQLRKPTHDLIQETVTSNVLKLSGHPSWIFLNWMGTEEFNVNEIKTLFMQLAFERGLLVLGTHNTTLAHDHKIQKMILNIYTEVFSEIQTSISMGTLRDKLKVVPLEPLFKIR